MRASLVLDFVSIQCSIADFVATRNAMNAADACSPTSTLPSLTRSDRHQRNHLRPQTRHVIISSRALRSYPSILCQVAASWRTGVACRCQTHPERVPSDSRSNHAVEPSGRVLRNLSACAVSRARPPRSTGDDGEELRSDWTGRRRRWVRRGPPSKNGGVSSGDGRRASRTPAAEASRRGLFRSVVKLARQARAFLRIARVGGRPRVSPHPSGVDSGEAVVGCFICVAMLFGCRPSET